MAYSKTLAAALALFSVSVIAQAPSTPTADGTTALHLAVRANDLPAVQRLLHSGANPSAANRYGVTPLSLAAENATLSWWKPF